MATNENRQILILSRPSLDLDDCLHMLRHTLDQSIYQTHIKLCPLLLKCYPHFIHISWHNWPFINFGFEDLPNMLNGVDVWRLSCMGKDLHLMSSAKILGNLGTVNRCSIFHHCYHSPLLTQL